MVSKYLASRCSVLALFCVWMVLQMSIVATEAMRFNVGCASKDCPSGECIFTKCSEQVHCTGAKCRFVKCQNPVCEGGKCEIVGSWNGLCPGGRCDFIDSETKVTTESCRGGKCKENGVEMFKHKKKGEIY